MINWLIEDSIFDSTLTPIVNEIQAQGHRVRVIDYFRGRTDYEQFFPEDECVLFYGSLNVATRILGDKTRQGLSWVPGVIGRMPNYFCTSYYVHLGKWLLNSEYCILPLAELSRRVSLASDGVIRNLWGENNRIFVRPNSPLKPFTGGVYSQVELADLDHFMARNCLNSPEMLVVIAKEIEIEAEWRIIISQEQILAASQYQQSGKPYYEQGMPDDIRALAEEVVKCGWQPDAIWVLDLCRSEGLAYVVEIGTLSCSALYKCELEPIVREASRIALSEWNEVNN